MPMEPGSVRSTARLDGKQYEAVAPTAREAERKLAGKLAAAKRGENVVGGTMTVDAWFHRWKALYKDSKGLTPKSLKMYDDKYKLYIRPRIGRLRLQDVKDVHLQEILNGQAGRSASHLSKLRLVMHSMFGRARQSHLIAYDPSEALDLPACTHGSHRSITNAERAAILQVAQTHRAGLLVLTLLYTGMRPGEAAALTWLDVDFVHNEIHVHAAVESGSSVIKTPKTAAGIRDIPIHAALRPLLLAASVGKAPLAPVFASRSGTHYTDAGLQALWRSFRRALDIHCGATLYRNKIVRSAIAPDLTLYCLRHTFCSDLQAAGVPINVAKELMGHSDIAVTANIYTHKDSDTLHTGIALLDGSKQGIWGDSSAGTAAGTGRP